MSGPELLFENDAFALFYKPEGLSFHSESGPGFVVLASEALGMSLYSVHRLDRMTSGLVLLAKTSDAAREFEGMFRHREVEKYYLALSLRKPKKKQGWIKGDMAPARRGSWKLLATNDNPAVTRFVSAASEAGERAFLVRPYTGKTHQIRVALKSLGAPIAGDLRYARTEEARLESRGYLHAYALRFLFGGEAFVFVQPPREGERFLGGAFVSLLKQWSAPWEFFS